VQITKVPIPVAFGPAFEGERIRKEQTHLEFGGNITPAFEYVTTREISEVEDGRIDVVGPDGEDLPEGSALPLAIWVEVAGRKMQPDFEPILERQIHHMVNGAEGVWHMGQRDITWIRISRAAWAGAFRLRHLGEILHAKLLGDYPAIVDKVQVTLFTSVEDVEPRLAEARRVYRARNQRLAALTDESVDTFYSCLLCQSFAPNHVCIITPERLGLCGAYNWLDGKAAYEIDPTGPNQPIVKGECLDPVRGQWAKINEYVHANSRQTIERFNAYSILEYPMTSCGCFEAIVGVLPECNGVMIVNREYTGETPLGMRFSALAGSTGGGQQTPGFIGVGKAYISSPKFISAEGGQQRIVWMPKELKDALREDLDQVGQRLEIDNFTELIADETIGTEIDSVRAHMERVKHPALSMWDLTGDSPDAEEPFEQEEKTMTVSRSKGPPPEEAPREPAKEVAAPPPQQPQAAGPPLAEQAIVTPPGLGWTASPTASLDYVISILERVRAAGLPDLETATTPEEQNTALQVSTAIHLLTAGANMLLMHSGPVAGDPDVEPAPRAEKPEAAAPRAATPKAAPPKPTEAARVTAAHKPAIPRVSTGTVVDHPVFPARIEAPTTFTLPDEPASQEIRTVTLGSRPQGAQIPVGGARVLPFRHFEGHVGHRPVLAMEVFDRPPKGYPGALRDAYGQLLEDPAGMASFCVEQLGAEAISVRLVGAHPDQGDLPPQRAAEVVGAVIEAITVPVIVTGCSHYEKNNEVIKHVANVFSGRNLLLNWVETDNYKTIAAAAMAYDHCLVAQTPMDVNLAKQLNILLTNMGVKPEKIVIDALTGALGYGLEYTYSVMERIRTTAFTGDQMLAMPMIGNPGYEVACIKESRAPEAEFPHWGPEAERGALLEIATAMALLNAGADLLIMYHPDAVRTVKRKIEEMTHGVD
jgi:CO dehydrogenase/CO-methylating acetyl-CoA synthase complex beta subunit/CO dehydrogenase/acetyl-CoA synthase delta subunit